MPAFDHLPADQRSALARETLRLRREGIRDQLVHALKLQGEEIIEEEIQLDVQQCTGPGEVVSVPPIGPADADAVARGREVYFEQGCEKCHGDDGTGVPDTPLFDDRGEPARARDLVHEPFKGGDDPESVYLRNLLGMPGTPHPASTTRDPAELVDLVHYCLSLAQRPKRTWTNYQRACYADGRAYLAAFPPGAQP